MSRSLLFSLPNILCSMQIFQCVIPPAPTDEGGITIFIDTRRMLAEEFTPEEIERLRHLNIGYYMPPSGIPLLPSPPSLISLLFLMVLATVIRMISNSKFIFYLFLRS